MTLLQNIQRFRRPRLTHVVVGMALLLLATAKSSAAEATKAPDAAAMEKAFASDIQPLVARYCHECHTGKEAEAELDLTTFQALGDIRKHPKAWLKVREMLDSGQMPPKDSLQPSGEELTKLQQWVHGFLTAEAAALAGDPGPVVLRRLNNAEYTYTLQDLTRLTNLNPAKEFPVDSAAGEGFTNVGNALVMSPALFSKYLDAAKDVAAHAVLTPEGMHFSPATTRRDWTNESLERIRNFYGRFSGSGEGITVKQQGIDLDINQGGRLPIEKYLTATIIHRDALRSGKTSVAEVARQTGLSPKYLGLLWQTLSTNKPEKPSLLVDDLRSRWRTAGPGDVPALAADIGAWQKSLWKYNSIGHIGTAAGPKSWMEAVNPVVDRKEFRLPLPASADGKEVVIYLAANDAGDGNQNDYVMWERPRLVAPGRPEILLRNLRPVAKELAARRELLFAHVTKYLAAAANARVAKTDVDVPALAQKHNVDAESLSAWLDYLGIGASGPVALGTKLDRPMKGASGYDFVQGWIGDDALSILANSSSHHVRIPGNMKPHGIAVHPSPTLSIGAGWRSSSAATVKISGAVQHAHPECGNGTAWSLELRRGNTRQRLAAGATQGGTVIPVGPIENVAVRPGDVISLLINPRDGNHSCDLTAIDLTVNDGSREWDLARDVSNDILASNPHADSFGNKDVWSFYSEPASGPTGHVIPADSLLAKWQAAGTRKDRQKLAGELQQLLKGDASKLAKDSPDAALYQQLVSLSGPLMTAALQSITAKPVDAVSGGDVNLGLDASRFGKHPGGAGIEPASLCVQAPSVIEIRLPADLVAGAEFVTAASIHSESAQEGSAQMQVLATKPSEGSLGPAAPIVVAAGSAARGRLDGALNDFRQLFPASLCYTKIVPVDEVVTLTLYYREDDQLRRLMLDEPQTAELDRLWDELLFVAREPLEKVTAFTQISEFATQDRPDMVVQLAPLRQPTLDRAEAFRQRLVATEPVQLKAVLDFAGQAYRRPLSPAETEQLNTLYRTLRAEEIPHEDAIRLTLTRVLVSPEFLYRAETPGPGVQAGPVTDAELASRLSYFLWSSQPDAELRQLAVASQLRQPEVLLQQTRRMLADGKTRRLAVEFACHWLHIDNFDNLNEKSERHFPTFAGLRGAMYEESIQFFTDLFQHNGSVLDILSADYTYLNEPLAAHYGIPGVTGPEFRRVPGVKQYSRGGILTQGTTLAKQSGASRTSPILRGTWLSEVVLGEKLPKPPKNVPVLAETAPEGLTERQLTERHTTDAGCAKCHVRIDPFGFALEGFDAIGRFRDKDASGLAIDTKTTLPDGTKVDGLNGLRDYLLTTRRDAFVQQFNKKLLGYALGRSVQLSDEPLLAEMQTVLKQNDYKLVPLVETIVRSSQFREIRGRDRAPDE